MKPNLFDPRRKPLESEGMPKTIATDLVSPGAKRGFLQWPVEVAGANMAAEFDAVGVDGTLLGNS